MAKFKQGKSGNPNGRPKGSKNKIPKNLKDKILFIAEDLEEKGIGLDDQALEDPKWFLENFMKPLIPKNIDMNVDASENLMGVAQKVLRERGKRSN